MRVIDKPNQPMPADAIDDADRPAALLDDQALSTWQTFNAMQATKQRHFDLLERLDAKKKNYNLDPTTRERRLLAFLLADHDASVKRFTQASLALKAGQPDDHQRLFDYIKLVNHATDAQPVTH